MAIAKESLNASLPSVDVLVDNLGKINKMLGICADPAEQTVDFHELNFRQPIDPDELQKRIAARVREQDEVICPQRVREGRVTPELRRYMARKSLK